MCVKHNGGIQEVSDIHDRTPLIETNLASCAFIPIYVVGLSQHSTMITTSDVLEHKGRASLKLHYYSNTQAIKKTSKSFKLRLYGREFIVRVKKKRRHTCPHTYCGVLEHKWRASLKLHYCRKINF